MTEAEWLACEDPLPMLECALTHSSRKRRLFAVACCRRITNIMTDNGKRAVDAAEGFADRSITRSRLHEAWRRVGSPKVTRRQYAAAAARAASVVSDSGYDGTHNAAVFAVNACVTGPREQDAQLTAERCAQIRLVRDIFGNPFRPVTFNSVWRTDTAVTLARTMYEAREFGAMPILADALQDAGCDRDDVLQHCRDAQQVHVRGCWVVDLVLQKE
jgi:hypothetical protein